MMETVTAVILAAGEGKRMKSSLPKVLHPVCGKPLISHVIDESSAVSGKHIVVIGHGADMVRELLGNTVLYAIQKHQLGTGHAVMQAIPFLPEAGTALVLCGDTPLLSAEILHGLLSAHKAEGASATVLTARLPDPSGYGRIIRSAGGSLLKIVEDRDASRGEREINEINTGTYAFDLEYLRKALGKLGNNNDQGEYYLTDCVEYLITEGRPVATHCLEDYRLALGVNDRVQLSLAARLMQERINTELMKSGVTIIDPATTFIDKGVTVGRETVIFPGTVLRGKTSVGENCLLGPFSEITDSKIENGVTVRHSVITGSILEDGVTVGPFAHLRPETRLRTGVKVGDFVEIKKSDIGKGSKIPHLSYVGDAQVGSEVNLGAGTIVVNYDGRNKHTTHIADGAFVGCNSNLVAPLSVGENAFVAAGSTVTKDIPAGALSIARPKQVNKDNMGKRLLNKKHQE